MLTTPSASGPVRPSGWWYAAAAGIAALGLFVGIGLLVGGVRGARQVGEERTTLVPGEPGLITVEEPDSFTLYYAGPRIISSTAEIPRLTAQVGAEVRPVGGGPAVSLAPYEPTSATLERDVNGGIVVPLQTFTIDRPGDYTVSSEQIPGIGEFDAALYVVTSPYEPLARSAVAAVAVIAVGIVFGLIIAVGVGLARGRSRRAGGGRFPPGPTRGAPAALSPVGAAPPASGWPGVDPGSGPLVPPLPPGYGPGPDGGPR